MQIIAEVSYFKHCRCGTQIYHVKSMWLTPAEKQIIPAVIGKKWSCLQNKGQLRYIDIVLEKQENTRKYIWLYN